MTAVAQQVVGVDDVVDECSMDDLAVLHVLVGSFIICNTWLPPTAF